jgi:glycosyltransferase involved in cell wall biosynthesis
MLAIRAALIERGDKCSIVATSRSAGGTEQHDVFHPRSALKLLALLRSIPFDVVHLHIGGEVTRRVILLALAVGILGRGKSVFTMHSGGYANGDQGKGWLARFAFRRFGKLIAVNDDLAEVFQRLVIDDKKIRVIAPYALAEPDPSIELPTALAEFVDQHSPVLLSVGGLEPEYEPFVQIEALAEIRSRHPNAGLTILGDGSIRPQVEKAVAAGGGGPIMLAGNVPHPVALHLMQAADAVLRITRYDGDAISVREALFLGRPVIATKTGKRPAGVHLIDELTPTAIARAVDAVMRQDGTIVRAHDDGMQNISEVLDLYERLALGIEHDIESVSNECVRADVR